ncbi:MAG: hypothetical protein V4474_04410 [Patescibacteria group bacterium]
MQVGYQSSSTPQEAVEKLGNAVREKAARRERREKGVARPSSAPYYRTPAQIAAAMTLLQQQLPEKDLPRVPPQEVPLVPELPKYVADQRACDERSAQVLAQPRAKAVQLSLFA